MSVSSRLVYLAFGKPTYHQEAVFSIVSALARLRETPEARIDIQVYTDAAEPYEGLPIAVQLMAPDQLERWSQPIGYHFRAKHTLLREVLSDCERAVLIDTDTFFRHSPQRLFARVTPGGLLCNAKGPAFGEISDQPLYRHLAGPLQAQGLADDAMTLTNSGVIGLTATDAGLLDLSLQLMDAYYEVSGGAYTVEEFMLATAARKQGMRLAECPDVIHHYWSRKRLFRAKIQAWHAKHAHDPVSAAALADVERVTDVLPRPPAVRRTLYKLATLPLARPQRQFARELLYGCYPYANEFDAACGPVWWEKAVENVMDRSGGALSAEQVLPWLEQPFMRLLLGRCRQAIVEQLTARFDSGSRGAGDGNR